MRSAARFFFRDFQLENGGDEQQWLKTEKAKELMEDLKFHILDESLCTKQAKRLEIGSAGGATLCRRVFMKLTTRTTELGILKTGIGGRNNSVQSNFRKALIETYHSTNPDPLRKNEHWCPVTSLYHDATSTCAAHLFAYHHGQDTMDAIFGTTAEPELFSSYNGILMSKLAEERLEKGYYVIVPDVSVDAPLLEIRTWHKMEPKEYKIRVVDSKRQEMQQYISPSSQETWNDLDGRRVTFFKSNFRPRARYLYFLYCVTMLRRSWTKEQPGSGLRDDLGKPYWGTTGHFMQKNLLMAFVEEMGHEYEPLLEGAESEVDNMAPVETALAAANEQIKLSVGGKGALSYAHESEDEESDDGEDEDEDNNEWSEYGNEN